MAEEPEQQHEQPDSSAEAATEMTPDETSTPEQQVSPAESNTGASNASKMPKSNSVKARMAIFEQQQQTSSAAKPLASPKSSPSKLPRTNVAVESAPAMAKSTSVASLLGEDYEDVTPAQPIASTSKLEPPPASKASSTTSSTASAVTIFGIVLVDFDHALGPKCEYSFPAHLAQDPDLSTSLPFLALPDGAHMRDEDYSYFHLLCPTVSQSTVFGISCNRQISSDQLLNRTADITRSTVQKAIVVLASKPVFGPIRDKLGVITRAFFAQKNFGDTSILVDFFSSLESGLGFGADEESAMYMGTSLRELIYKFRFKTLMLLKLLMLQKKVMFYGSQVERLCTYQYSLVSLIPSLLLHLDDAASPELDERSKAAERPTELRTSDKKSLLRYLGLPLNVFGKDAFFQPYLPLQQIDLLRAESYLVGTTNSIFQQQRDCKIDVLVNIDTAAIDFRDPTLASLVNLTAPDRKWMDDIVSTVSESWNAADPARPIGMKFVGSDDFLRAKFEEYICSALSAIKFVDYLGKGKEADVLLSGAAQWTDIVSGLSSYNEAWIRAFKQTPAFELWDRTTDAVIFDLVEPRHPCEGQTHLVQDVGIRLNQGLHDLHLEENLAPAREVITKGLATGSEGVWKFYSNVKGDLAKRQLEYNQRREKDLKEKGEVSSPDVASPGTPSPLLSTHVIAGASEVGSRATSLASSVGSFLSSKKSSFFASRPSAEPTIPASESVLTAPQLPLSDSPLAADTFPPIATLGSSTSSNPDSKPLSPTPAVTSPFSSFFRTTSESASTFPSFFRKTSGNAANPGQPPLKELSLGSPSSSPVMRPLSGERSPRLSPKMQTSRPSSVASDQSNLSIPDSRSPRHSRDLQDVAL